MFILDVALTLVAAVIVTVLIEAAVNDYYPRLKHGKKLSWTFSKEVALFVVVLLIIVIVEAVKLYFQHNK